jgi:hypothetical protein
MFVAIPFMYYLVRKLNTDNRTDSSEGQNNSVTSVVKEIGEDCVDANASLEIQTASENSSNNADQVLHDYLNGHTNVCDEKELKLNSASLPIPADCFSEVLESCSSIHVTELLTVNAELDKRRLSQSDSSDFSEASLHIDDSNENLLNENLNDIEISPLCYATVHEINRVDNPLEYSEFTFLDNLISVPYETVTFNYNNQTSEIAYDLISEVTEANVNSSTELISESILSQSKGTDLDIAMWQAASGRWEDFNESKSRLIVWIGEMEETLQETPDTKAELGEMKTLIERYKVCNLLA